MYNFNEKFPNYDVTPDGKVFKNGEEVKPFKSNKYLQVLLFDSNHKRYICGVHIAVAMKYIENFYEGCVVHHKDGNCHNNNVENLQIMSRSDHSRSHMEGNTTLADYIKKIWAS